MQNRFDVAREKRKRRKDLDRIGSSLKTPYAAATATSIGQGTSKPTGKETVVKDDEKESDRPLGKLWAKSTKRSAILRWQNRLDRRRRPSETN